MDQRSDSIRAQRERAIGSYELRIDVAPTSEAGWRSLRRALRFSRSDDAWLRARVPGPVRKGAEVDLLGVLARVEEAGHTGHVARRPESDSDD